MTKETKKKKRKKDRQKGETKQLRQRSERRMVEMSSGWWKGKKERKRLMYSMSHSTMTYDATNEL